MTDDSDGRMAAFEALRAAPVDDQREVARVILGVLNAFPPARGSACGLSNSLRTVAAKIDTLTTPRMNKESA